MLASLGRLWRAFATGLCFLVYALMAFLCSLTVLPLLLLWPGDSTARERRIRLFMGWSFRALVMGVEILGVGRVEVEGREWLKHTPGRLVVATHPMYLDMVALLMFMPQADCVVKSAMLRNPFYRRFVKAAGYISNGDSGALVESCVGSLKQGRSLVLFPEGTRSVPGEPPRFRRGAAQVAVRADCEILPVVIQCTPLALSKSHAWWQVPERTWRLHIRFCPPQTLASFGHQEDLPHGVAARRLNRALEDFFKQQLAHHEQPDRRTEAAHHHLARS